MGVSFTVPLSIGTAFVVFFFIDTQSEAEAFLALLFCLPKNWVLRRSDRELQPVVSPPGNGFGDTVRAVRLFPSQPDMHNAGFVHDELADSLAARCPKLA